MTRDASTQPPAETAKPPRSARLTLGILFRFFFWLVVIGTLLYLLLPMFFTSPLIIPRLYLMQATELGMAALAYGQNHSEKLPPADSWPEILKKEMKLPDDTFGDPSDPQAGRAFAMNQHLGSRPRRMPHSEQTVLFFECQFGSPSAGGPELLPPTPRHKGGYAIVFANGQADLVPPEKVRGLIWNPVAPSP